MEEGSLEMDKLTLSPTYEVTKVVNPIPEGRKFKQNLLYRHNPFLIKTESIPFEKFKIKDNCYGQYVVIPVSKWFRKQLDCIEEYVTLNISLPSPLSDKWKARDDKDTPYRKIWDGDELFVPLSKWCQILKCENDCLKQISQSDFDDGTYEICVSISGVFYGEHKENKLASITMFVQSIVYKPKEDNVDAIIDEILKGSGEHPSKHAKRRRKKETV